jgi:hypothetical protein
MKLKRVIIFIIMMILPLGINYGLFSFLMQDFTSRTVQDGTLREITTAQQAVIQSEIQEAMYRSSHNPNDLRNAFNTLITKYRGVIGMSCWHNPPSGTRVIATIKNPGYMSSSGSNPYCYIYWEPIVVFKPTP